MRRKRIINIFCIMFVVTFLITALPFKVRAAESAGTKKSVTVSGYTYTYHSYIYKSSSSVNAFVEVSCAKKWPSGYIGLNSRLYNSSGTLVKSSGWLYDEGGGYLWNQPSGSTTQRGTYYSKGQVKFYNGNGYNTYTCNSSPNMQLSAVRELEYEENELGLTFGSDYLAETIEECPDLVRVIGVNGKEGYVYNFELNSDVNTPSEAIAYSRSCPLTKTIAVYAEDGQTVIDTFELSFEKGVIK